MAPNNVDPGNLPERTTLAFVEMSEWTLTLIDGSELIIYADSVSTRDGFMHFEALALGDPLRLIAIAKVPSDLVDSYLTTYVGRIS